MRTIFKFITEDTRSQHLSKTKASEKGRERYKKIKRSKVATRTADFNSIDMNKLFKDDILTLNIPVKGETNNYIVRISFGGIIKNIREKLKQGQKLDLRTIMQACTKAFNENDVYTACSCPDSKFRFRYWNTRNDTNSGEKENRPSDITNPHDSLGSSCKHVLAVVNNIKWIIPLSSTIYNYIEYMKKNRENLYADIIYPALYGKKYEGDVQMSFDTELGGEEDTETTSAANIAGKKRGQFSSTRQPDRNRKR